MENTKISVDGPTTQSGAANHTDGNGDYHEVSTQEVAVMTVRRVRLTYAVLLIIGFVLGIIVKLNIVEWITKWAIDKGCNGSSECVGVQSVYRISFAMAMFFFIHYVLSSSWNLCLNAQQRISLNQQGIFIKLLSLIPFFLVSFAIPNDFFVVFAWFALVVSVIFLVCQLIVLLGFCYTWNEEWTAQEDSKYVTGLLVCTVVMVIGGLVFIGLSYKWFGSDASCQTNQALISLNLIFGIIYFVMSMVVAGGSILPSAAVFLYTAYTCFSALSGGPGGACNALHTTGITQLVISTSFSAISLVYMTVSAGTSRGAFQIEEVEESVEEAEANAFAFFHVQMFMGSCYLAMLISNWTILGSDTLATLSTNQYQGPLAAKMTSDFLCIALYMWTLIAPMICTDREFS